MVHLLYNRQSLSNYAVWPIIRLLTVDMCRYSRALLEYHILDIFLTNQPSLIEVIPDHEIVSATSLTSISHNKPESRNVISWHKADFKAINGHIAQFADAFFHNIQLHYPS